MNSYASGALFTKVCRTSSLRYLTYGLPKLALNLRFTTNSQPKRTFGHLSDGKPVNPSSFRCFDLQFCQKNNFEILKPINTIILYLW